MSQLLLILIVVPFSVKQAFIFHEEQHRHPFILPIYFERKESHNSVADDLILDPNGEPERLIVRHVDQRDYILTCSQHCLSLCLSSSSLLQAIILFYNTVIDMENPLGSFSSGSNCSLGETHFCPGQGMMKQG